MRGVREWLEDLGLGAHADIFESEDVDFDTLRQLSNEDLKELGLTMGARKKLLAAIEALSSASEPHAPTHPREAERRQITVMFCDLVGSTALSEKLDPEDLRTLMQAYQQACGKVIERYGGHVAQYLGDGLMTYFGWPQAHEDDAERSVRAALEIVDAIKVVDAPEPLQIRIGIATGPVVVGETGGGDASVPKLAIGETPNLASRLQGLAGRDEIVVGPSTRRLLGGTFELDDLSEQTLKGIIAPVQAHRVTALAATEGRFEAQHRHLTPLVGREAEMTKVMACWEKTKVGDGQVILLSGEPGIGKSRITQTLRERVAGEPHIRLRYQCSPYHTNSALHPFIEQLERAAAFKKDDSPGDKLDKLEALTSAAPNDVGRSLFAAMLSLPVDRYPPLVMTPKKQKEETLRALTDQVAALAAVRPILLVFEDAHWVDQTSQEALNLIVSMVAGHRVLVVITHRPEYQPAWIGQGQVTPLALSRLGRTAAAAIVARVSDISLSDSILDQIIAKTDGIPLFVEELTKTVVETGAVTANTIPETLQDSLMARLDRLGPVKEVAQIGAAVGREFNYRLIVALSPLSAPDLDAALDKLIDSMLVHCHGTPPDATYTFKHSLVQDAAYESLLKRNRRALHEEIAKVLEETFPETMTSKPELLAHHYTEAGHAEPAIDCWRKAGELALRRAANVDAINHFNRGVALLDDLPQSDARDCLELSLQLALGPAIMAARGQGTPEMRQAYARARALGRKLGDTREHFRALWGLWRSHFILSEHDMARELGEQCLALAETSKDEAFGIMARFALGGTQLFMGDLRAARGHLEFAIPIHDAERHRSLAFLYGLDPGAINLAYMSFVEWYSGFPDQSVKIGRAALDLAKASDHPLTVATAHNFFAMTHLCCRDWRRVLSATNTAIALAEEQGLPQVRTLASTLHGRAIVEAGDFEHGIPEIEQGIAQRKAIDVRIARLFELSLLAESYHKADRIDEGLCVVAEALDYADRTDERFHLPELHRLKGKLLMRQDAAAAECCFHDAIETAHSQSAQSLALRAATDLSRLWRKQGKTKEARALLDPIYSWFTEGLDMADLKDAKALLEELEKY